MPFRYYQFISKRFIAAMQEEYINLPIWLVVCFIFGIVCYFSLEAEPSLIMLNFILITLAFLAIISRKKILLKTLFISLSMFSLGVAVPTFKFYGFNPKGLSARVTARVVGEVEAIKPKEFGWQVLLRNVDIEGVIKEETPSRIRFNLHDIGNNRLLLGDIISVKLSLMPPPGPLIPGGYDFSKQAYFNEIGGVGYNKSDPIIIDHNIQNKTLLHSFQSLRRNIYDHIILNLGDKNGNFAAAVIVGETSGIDLKTLNAMRRSGLAHILCVSGIHLSLVAMIFFISIRVILNSSNFIANNYNIKKIGALGAICGSFLYLLISGMQVAATRAFIMTTVYMLSVFLEKRAQALRSVFFAAFMILFIWPEYIIHPSFILSFTAVLSLIACAGFNFTPFEVVASSKGKLSKLKQYILLNINSTLAASLATTPFVLFFFHVNPNYSLLANLLAVPVTTFILMPAAVLAIMLMPLKLDYIAWKLMDFAINAITYVANFIEPLPYASLYFGHLEEGVIICYTLAFIIFCIGKYRIKIIGIILLIVSTILILLTPKPDMIIDSRTKIYAVNIDGELKISNDKLGKLKSSYWTSWFGQSEVKYLAEPIDEIKTASGKYIKICQKRKCKCDGDLLVNLSKGATPDCENIIDKDFLKKFGTALIYCGAKKCEVKYSLQRERFNFR
ncbi:MAG: ComEC/Rec2 family protein [Rickettsiaceae bacterium]|jgi:competence protein ComEC|nr:ComEC/Rec2 family protein [Rickettsiaceae bacterium]